MFPPLQVQALQQVFSGPVLPWNPASHVMVSDSGSWFSHHTWTGAGGQWGWGTDLPPCL